MQQLSVPQLRLFSNSPISYNQYKHKMSLRRELEATRDHQPALPQNRYKFTDQMRQSSRQSSRERYISAEREYKDAAVMERMLQNIKISRERLIAAPLPVPMPMIEVLPPPPPPVLLPMPIMRTDLVRGSRACTMMASPQNKYYEMSKKVLMDKGRSSPRSPRQGCCQQKENTNRSFEVNTKANYQTFSISRDHYLNEPTIWKNVQQRQPQKPAEASQIFHNQSQAEQPKKGIQIISQQQPKKQPIPTPKQPQLPTPKNHPSPPPPTVVPSPSPSPPAPPAVRSLQSFHKQQLQLFKDLLQRQHIKFQQYLDQHEQQWILILEQVSKLKRQDQMRQMKKRIRQWRRRNVPGFDEITENVSTYTEISHNESIIRRELREIQDTHLKFDKRLEERFEEIQEYDFQLERNLKDKKSIDIGEIIKLKNQDLQLYRDITGEIGKLIEKYEKGTVQTERKIFSFFE